MRVLTSEVRTLFCRHHEGDLIARERYRLFTPNDSDVESSLSFVGAHDAEQLAVELRLALDALSTRMD
jgi:hypothetical protein